MIKLILGKIIGTTTTTFFEFIVQKDIENSIKKFEFLQIPHQEHESVLAQIIELFRDSEKTIAKCAVIGYKDKDQKIKQLRTPIATGTEIFRAKEDYIKEIIKLDPGKVSGFIGKLEGYGIDISADIEKMISKHIAVLAKSGSGKSYTVGVLAEELMDKNVPVVIIDPHGEYSSLKYPNENTTDKQRFEEFNIKPKSFIQNISEYGDIKLGLKPIKLNSTNLNTDELIHLLPAKLNSNQINLLYTALRYLKKPTFEELINELEMIDGNAKWSLINIIDYLKKLDLFSSASTDIKELVQTGKCSIINLKGFNPELQEIIAYKLMNDIFAERKKGTIPPLLMIVEEAHNFCPERSFGEAKSSKILRTIASEGRKFGLGLCIVSQRPSRVDKSVLSQCSTQIILKITNPNDLKAITSSVEGITSESAEEIINLPIGNAMMTGIVDIPLFVNIRPRKTKHGGTGVSIFEEEEDSEDNSLNKEKEGSKENGIMNEIDNYSNRPVLPVIKPAATKKELTLMAENEIESIKTFLIPAVLFQCKKNSETFPVVCELIQGKIVSNIQESIAHEIPDLSGLSLSQLGILNFCIEKVVITPGDVMIAKNIDFSQAGKTLSELEQKNFLEYDGKYRLNKAVLVQPKELALYSPLIFEAVDYDEKLEPTVNVEEIKNKLSLLSEVVEQKEAFIIWHKVVYKKDS
ncbi:ATP-binding protein [Nanoarchaeota archaeon]